MRWVRRQALLGAVAVAGRQTLVVKVRRSPVTSRGTRRVERVRRPKVQNLASPLPFERSQDGFRTSVLQLDLDSATLDQAAKERGSAEVNEDESETNKILTQLASCNCLNGRGLGSRNGRRCRCSTGCIREASQRLHSFR